MSVDVGYIHEDLLISVLLIYFVKANKSKIQNPKKAMGFAMASGNWRSQSPEVLATAES